MDFSAIPEISSIEELPALEEVANFHVGEENYWRVWKYNGLQIRLVMTGSNIERITFINEHSNTRDSIRFAYLMQNIGHIFNPDRVFSNIREMNDYVVKYIYFSPFNGYNVIRRMAYGTSNTIEDPENVLHRIFIEMRAQDFDTPENLF